MRTFKESNMAESTLRSSSKEQDTAIISYSKPMNNHYFSGAKSERSTMLVWKSIIKHNTESGLSSTNFLRYSVIFSCRTFLFYQVVVFQSVFPRELWINNVLPPSKPYVQLSFQM
jgi:hypothetical protein